MKPRHLCAACILSLFFAFGSVRAATINVNGSCSLSNAIESANSDSAIGGCSAGSGADILVLTEDVTLSSLLPQLVSAITIDGGGKYISGGGSFGPVLHVVSTGVVALNNVTIKNGSNGSGFGGGIFNQYGDLSLIDSTVDSNLADWGGGIYSYGSLTLTNSTVRNNTANNGGGLLCNDSCSLVNSTITGNSAQYGGGIHITFTSSLGATSANISGNNGSIMGGGIYSAGISAITNSTISGNSAGFGGGIYTAVPIGSKIFSLMNSTVSGNSATQMAGGVNVNSYTEFRLGHTILAGNTEACCWNFPDGQGDMISDGYNVMGPINGAVSGNLVSNISDISSLYLGPLANNGGRTQTMAISPTSVAYNAGDSTCTVATDQRGNARPQGSNCDIGAFEFSPPVFVGSTTALTVAQSAGATDIKELLHASNVVSGLTLTWTQDSAPSHGVLSFIGATASSGSTDITPGGTITYTPATGYVGSDSFTVIVSDGIASSTRTITVTVGSALSVTVSPNTLNGMTIGTPVNQTFTASGGYDQYTYSISSGSLPSGLTLSTGGLLSGTPTSSGSYNFTVQATDSSNGAGAPFIGSQAFTVTLAPLTASQSGIQTLKGGVAASISVIGCAGINSPEFIVPPAGAPANFLYGLLGFTLTGCEVGRTATVTVTYSQNLPPALSFYKYLGGRYSTFGATVGSNSVTFQLTDGGSGDADGLPPNGSITDPGGLGIPTSSVSSVPTLSKWGSLILFSLMAMIALVTVRRSRY